MSATRITGGCQCGAVRYRIEGPLGKAGICHCRMCQKAFGSYFAPLAGVKLAEFAWVKGARGVFKASQAAERGFCRDCGTPLFFRYPDRDCISLSLGSLDDLSRIVPAKQYGIEAACPLLR